MSSVKHWILRVGDGVNFKNSSKHNIWGIKGRWLSYMKDIKKGDILWFVVNKKSSGKIGLVIACSTFEKFIKRQIGPLVNITSTDEELGWKGEGAWDIEIHYKNLYNTENCDIISNIKGQIVVRKNKEDHLIEEYENIKKYSKIKKYF